MILKLAVSVSSRRTFHGAAHLCWEAAAASFARTLPRTYPRRRCEDPNILSPRQSADLSNDRGPRSRSL